MNVKISSWCSKCVVECAYFSFSWILIVLSYVTFIYWFVFFFDSYVVIHTFWFIRWFYALFSHFSHTSGRAGLPSLKECFVFFPDSIFSVFHVYLFSQAIIEIKNYKKCSWNGKIGENKISGKIDGQKKLFSEERLMERFFNKNKMR